MWKDTVALDLAKAVVSINGDQSPLRNALAGAKSATDKNVAAMQARLNKLGDTMRNVGKKMTRYVTLPIVAAFGLALRANIQQEDAENALAVALRNHGAAVDSLMPKFKKFASEMQRQTIYGDELVLSQMAYAQNLGVTTDKLEGATKAAIGLAAKYRIDLQTAMMLVGRAALGQTQMLTRYGIVLEETLSPQEKFNALLKIGAGAFKLAKAEVHTFSGALKQMRNELGDAMEQGAEPLIPTLTKLAEKVKDASGWFKGLSSTTKEGVAHLALVGAAAGPVVSVFGTLIKLRIAAQFLGMTKQATLLGSTMRNMGKAGLIVGTAILSWQLGKMLGKALGLEKVFIRMRGGKTLAEAEAKTMEGVAEYEAGKKVRLTARAGREGISLGEMKAGEVAEGERRRAEAAAKQKMNRIIIEASSNLEQAARAKAVSVAERGLAAGLSDRAVMEKLTAIADNTGKQAAQEGGLP